MIYYSDKHDALTRGAAYIVNGERRVYLGFTHVDGGKTVQYRFKGEGPNSYASKTAQELDRADVQPIGDAV